MGLLLTVVTITPFVPWYARLLGGAWNDPKGEVMIVLGGGTIDQGALAPGSYWRSAYANRVWQDGGFREIVVSGWRVAPPMREFLLCHGVPAAGGPRGRRIAQYPRKCPIRGTNARRRAGTENPRHQ